MNEYDCEICYRPESHHRNEASIATPSGRQRVTVSKQPGACDRSAEEVRDRGFRLTEPEAPAP